MSPQPDDSGCPKCGHDQVDVSSISTTGSGLSKMFDIQTNKFETVTCTNCGLRVLELQVDADQFRTASDLGISDQ